MKRFLGTFILSIIFQSIFYGQGFNSQVVSGNENGIKIKIEFNSPRYKQKGKGIPVIDYFEYTNSSAPGSPKLPVKTIYVAIPPKSKISSVKFEKKQVSTIQNVIPSVNPSVKLKNDSTLIYVEEKLSSEFQNKSVFPESDFKILDYLWIRDYYCAAIQINTHKVNFTDRTIEELNSVVLNLKFSGVIPFTVNRGRKSHFDQSLESVILNYSQADMFRAYRKNFSEKDDSGDWINYEDEYVKLGIVEDGIYKITYSDLESFGVSPSSVSPSKFRMFFKGNEIPIFISGEEDGNFDASDFILFWAEKNYGDKDYQTIVTAGVDYKLYMDRYSDTSYVWLTWGGEDGKRLSEQNLFNSALNDTISTYKEKIHLEEDTRIWFYDNETARVNLPFWQENKVWTWQAIGSSGKKRFQFQANDIVSNGDVEILARIISNAAGDHYTGAHKMSLELNANPAADTIVFNFKETVNLSTQYQAGALLDDKNEISILALPTDASFSQSLIDWIDVKYDRFLSANDNSLIFEIDEGFSNVEKLVKITNIAANGGEIFLFKVDENGKKKINSFNYDANTNSILFSDTLSTGDKYALFTEDATLSPLFVYKKKFINLRSARTGEYVIVSHSSLASSAQQYADFVKSEYDVGAALIYVKDIYDEFSYGMKEAEAIQSFLESAYLNWNDPKPSYLLIIGDANYDYRNVIEPAPDPRKKDLVPSYGMPVSDVWYSTWDDANPNLQQMYVGRIPAETNEEVLKYLAKHQGYVGRVYDEYNKSYILFSSGDRNAPSELERTFAANEEVLNEVISPAPVGGKGTHFYMTIDPPTNFGPFTPEEVQATIDEGGLFISYIGHSGTQTWDNGITDVRDLKNKYSDRFPLITDFGCSTGRFAEADIDAFGEMFVCDSPEGQAIAYLANSSFGYLSTSVTMPKVFYETLLKDEALALGKAHFLAKSKLFSDYGSSDVNKVFNYCNLLFGDPIVGFQLPQKPNFTFGETPVRIAGNIPTDIDDSVTLKINYENLGKAPSGKLTLFISDTFDGSIIFEKTDTVDVPLYSDNIEISIPIKNKIGSHSIFIELDKNNDYDEINENDNSTTFEFNVASTSIRSLEKDIYYSQIEENIRILNPNARFEDESDEIVFEYSENSSFDNPSEKIIPVGNVSTEINVSDLTNDKRYWWRASLNTAAKNWSVINSFEKSEQNRDWMIDEKFNPEDITTSNVAWNETQKAWQLTDKTNILRIYSAGASDGGFGSILFNNQETLTNTIYWGIVSARLDTATLLPYDVRYFSGLPMATNADSLTNYINGLENGTTLILSISLDAEQTVIGWSPGTEVREAIKTLGSRYIDSVDYRDSWCIVGVKGAEEGSVPEDFSKVLAGWAQIDLSKTIPVDSGTIQFPVMGPSSSWKKLVVQSETPSGSGINFFPVGVKENGETDTLAQLSFTGNEASLESVNSEVYRKLFIAAKMYREDHTNQVPTIKTLSAEFDGLPELAINYQVVTLSADTIMEGESAELSFSAFNVGDFSADNFNVNVSIRNKTGEFRTLLDTAIVELLPSASLNFEYHYENTSSDDLDDLLFKISLDSEGNVKEYYEDNNIFEIPLYVKKDTTNDETTAEIALTIDGTSIIDGDFVSVTPTIQTIIDYTGAFPVSDTTAVKFSLDDNVIYYNQLEVLVDSVNNQIVYEYSASLENGRHRFKAIGDHILLDEDFGITRTFTVSDETKLINVYNYPNPFQKETYFTFKLPQIPDELKIKIYTVAGRLIREIEVEPAALKYDFNKIYWDGLDEDGDELANGVYLYKIIIKKGDKTDSIIQKLAIIK